MCVPKKDLLDKWAETATQLTKLKQKEMELRRQVQQLYFPKSTEGINKVVLEEGTLIYQEKLSRVVDQEKVKKYLKINPAIKKFLRVSYNLDTPAYRQAVGYEKEILEDIITTKPLAPVLEFKK